MKIPLLALAALTLTAPALADESKPAPSPNEIVEAAPASDWVTIAPSDLIVMDLAPDRDGNKRRVVIQLMPPPFSQGWIGNIRKLAEAHWWDGTAITRVQDNYVVQWGDPDAEDKAKARPLPAGLTSVPESEYSSSSSQIWPIIKSAIGHETIGTPPPAHPVVLKDPYADSSLDWHGWPIGTDGGRMWPIHCYGMVGVGRNYSPDTGSGAELYTVIGTPPRHLDRNIALVGRVIEGMEYLSSLPRGHGLLGFYRNPEHRVPIRSIRLGYEASGLPAYQYLSTESTAFAKYEDARANRRDPFFIHPAGGADICNVPVPVRRAP
ncbi:peptidylprolyl isomerase [Novosphingobium sp. ZN18A2]|uniref:peptidylprolyl isomerase n=1 Tax=Novosphingobium sp. ZN18A2 TaxID=3079861 RepID=UPI0030D59D6B